MAMLLRMLFFLGTTFFTLVKVDAAPARYDQRQEGEFNLHAKLENLLFVVAIPSNNDVLSDLALQALELKQQLVSRSKEQESSIQPDEEAHAEPYSLGIVQINENTSNKGNMVDKTEGNRETANILNQQTIFSINKEHIRPISDRAAKNVKAFEFPKSREEPAIMAYFVDARKILESKIEDDGRARNVVENVWNPNVESETSLKKQLLLRREEDDVALSSSNTDKNDVAPLSEDKQQNELRLLGDGIENCGPGRHRDASGICQFDESASALL